MSRKKISTTIYITPEQNDLLKLLHDRTKVPVAVYIREGIDLALRHYAHILPGQLALDVTPPPPASEKTERVEAETRNSGQLFRSESDVPEHELGSVTARFERVDLATAAASAKK
jgi:Ribbon-helix-helix domain